MKFLKSLYIHNQFYIYISINAICFLVSYWIKILYPIAWILTLILSVLFLADLIVLYRFNKGLHARRILPEKFSNSDQNPVAITITNQYPFSIYTEVIDELAVQFQKRDFKYLHTIKTNQTHDFNYMVRPVSRGEYVFGNLNVYASSFLKIIKRKYQFQKHQMVAVYPSFIQMQQYDFLAISNKLTQFGFKKIRKIGNSQTSEQIKDYVQGDDFRTVNWKATAK
ncbi:MAG: DUF58 domain-containing protein, partial [Oceanihabitans sp.]